MPHMMERGAEVSATAENALTRLRRLIWHNSQGADTYRKAQKEGDGLSELALPDMIKGRQGRELCRNMPEFAQDTAF